MYVHTFSYSAIIYSSQYQKTAFDYASENNTVRVLLEKGVDPNTCDNVSGIHVITLYI